MKSISSRQQRETYFDMNNPFIDVITELIDRRVLEHPFIERLKNISFLGILHDLYRIKRQIQTSRYAHTLAVAYLTLSYSSELRHNELEKLIAVLTALLHDIGHGPFSHSVEAYLTMWQGFKENHEQKLLPNKFQSFIDSSYKFLPSVLISRYSSKDLAGVLYDTFRGNGPFMNIHKIFRYPIAPDNLDGINRAAYYLKGSIKSENYESLNPIDLVHESCRIITASNDSTENDKSSHTGLDAFYQLERKLYENVFYSPTTIAAEAMLCRSIELVYPYGKSMPYQDLDDQALIQKLQTNKNSSILWKRILARDLFMSFHTSHADKSSSVLIEYALAQRPGRTFYRTKKYFESKLANELQIDPDFVIFHSYYQYSWHSDIQTYLYSQPSLFENAFRSKDYESQSFRNLKTIIFIPPVH